MNELISDMLPVLLLAFFLWMVGLTALLWWVYKHINKLGKGVKQGNLIKVLDEVVKGEDNNKVAISEIKDDISEIRKLELNHFQKLGLIRFNPFNETGGDNSFSLCLLDDKDNGFVISCLHTRDRTRIYAKPIDNGKCEIKLSKEERKALDKAGKK